MTDLPRDWEQLQNRTVLVIGDLILDRYTWGNAERVSPEAPVVVLQADADEVRPGGAASVAHLLRHLDAKVVLAGVVGSDSARQTLIKLLHDESIDCELVEVVAERPTTTKERFVGRVSNRHPHHILRLDRETREPIDHKVQARLRDGIQRCLSQVSAVIISDYGKGVCTPELVADVINAARECRRPVIVDPARIEDYHRYRGATIVTPNRPEAELATGLRIETPEDALHAGRRLVETHRIAAAFVTIDRDGIAVVAAEAPDDGCIAPAIAREVYDITGAGDMVIAVTGLCQAAGWSYRDTVHMANMAAGLEIEQLGIAPVTWQQLAARSSSPMCGEPETTINTCPRSPRSCTEDKIMTLAELKAKVAQHRAAGRSIVFTNGCFDLLHVGHVTCLQQAAMQGDLLVVAINSDSSVTRQKGPGRPVIPAADRAHLVSALTCVDFVIVFDEDSPERLLAAIRPDVLVKGGTTHEVVGRDLVARLGGTVHVSQALSGISTSEIISRICETQMATRA